MPERLTEKHIVDNIDCGYKIKKDTCEDGIIQGWNKTDAINKLGKLEDIEEELGIDLKTFKAIHNIHTPIYYKRHANRKTISCNFPRKVFSTRKGVWYLCVDTYDYYLRLKNYGKTWALTKEELL